MDVFYQDFSVAEQYLYFPFCKGGGGAVYRAGLALASFPLNNKEGDQSLSTNSVE